MGQACRPAGQQANRRRISGLLAPDSRTRPNRTPRPPALPTRKISAAHRRGERGPARDDAGLAGGRPVLPEAAARRSPDVPRHHLRGGPRFYRSTDRAARNAARDDLSWWGWAGTVCYERSQTRELYISADTRNTEPLYFERAPAHRHWGRIRPDKIALKNHDSSC